MTEEAKKKAAETAKAEAEAKAAADKEEADAELDAELDGLSDEEKAEKLAEREALNTDKEADYKQQLEEEKKRREAAEAALAKDRFKGSERKRDEALDGEGEGEEDEEEKPITPKELEKRLAAERQSTLRETQAGRIQDIAANISESATEAELIIEIHKNRTWPASVPLEEQLAEAQAIANRKRNASKQKELARAVNSKDRASKDSASAHRDGMDSPAPKQSKGDEASYKRAGFLFDAKSKLWKKKLPNGKFLMKDPKDKRTWVA